MKRIFLVLALALMLLFGTWGQAFAAEVVIDDEGEDHPWGGSANNGDQPQYRNAYPNIGVLYSSVYIIDIILTNHYLLHQLRDEMIVDKQTDDRYQDTATNNSRSSTRKTSVR